MRKISAVLVVGMLGLVTVSGIVACAKENISKENEIQPRDIKPPILEIRMREYYNINSPAILTRIVLRNPNPFTIWVSQMDPRKNTLDIRITLPNGSVIRCLLESTHMLPLTVPILPYSIYFVVLDLKTLVFGWGNPYGKKRIYNWSLKGKYTIWVKYRSIVNNDEFETGWRGELEAEMEFFIWGNKTEEKEPFQEKGGKTNKIEKSPETTKQSLSTFTKVLQKLFRSTNRNRFAFPPTAKLFSRILGYQLKKLLYS